MMENRASKKDNLEDISSFITYCTDFCDAFKSRHLHCNYCSFKHTDYWSAKRHVIQCHINRAVKFNDEFFYPCKLKHVELGISQRYHFHCPICLKTIFNKRPFCFHLERHSQIDNNSKPKKALNSSNASGDALDQSKLQESGKKETCICNTVSASTTRRDEQLKQCCTLCNKIMHPKSLPRHHKNVHFKQMISSCVCVDEKLGIFLVRKHMKGGIVYRSHVKKMVHANGIEMKCELDACSDFMEVAKLSKMPTVECIHLQQSCNAYTIPEKEVLTLESLNDLSGDGRLKILSDATILRCAKLHEVSENEMSNLIVAVKDSKRFIHFSVLDDGIHYYSRLGRVTVTADMVKGYLDCSCCSRSRGCVHKGICKWYLHENKLLEEFLSGTNHTEEPFGIQESKEFDAKKEITIYPPKDPKVIEKMCLYLLNNKKIPIDFVASSKKLKLPKFVPKETECYYCGIPLPAPERISRQACFLQMDRLRQNLETFCKTCSNCGVSYSYQEYSDNVHNFNDTFLISIEVCNFLRNCLLQHIPIGSIVKVLEAKIGSSLNSQTILNAYFHFDAMSDHCYDYSCVMCGHHPKILVMDLNRKIAFRCPAETLQVPEDYDINADDQDQVNAEDFWQRVELCMVLRGYPERNVNKFNVKPSLFDWAPYIGEKTRKCTNLLNTEHRKVNPITKTLEKDCREITEERLLELLSQSSAAELVQLEKKLGGTGIGSKLDLIMNIKKTISNDETKFSKAFCKIWGYSGGWISALCPHGIVYALKFVLRAESPRDYVDLLLSMKHQPTICIIDMAHMVVAHGNRRKKNMFHPHNGMIAEPSQQNIDNAFKRNFSVSFPFLLAQNSQESETDSENEEIHPVTGSKMKLCLFDRFHETNTKRREEVLRRITHVKELNGMLNTQRDEQLHAAFRYDGRFFNNMKAVNHIFLFRSLIDSRNDKINKEKTSRIATLSQQKIGKDYLGRLMLSKEEDKFQEELIQSSKLDWKTNCEKSCKSESDKKRSLSNSFDLSSDVAETPSKIQATDSSFSCIIPVKADKTNDIKSTDSKVSFHDQTLHQTDPQISTRSWNIQLNLTENEREILMSSNLWIDDSIINAAITLLRGETKNLNGMQDVVVAQKEGFHHDPNVESFVQILHINNNHWITVSNVLCKSYEFEVTPGQRVRPSISAYVYDSLQQISKKCGNIKYPFNVCRSICELTKPIGAVEMMVADVQQQNGTNDCGVFAVAFAACLCFNINPCTLMFDQDVMRKALIKCLDTNDITTFIPDVTLTNGRSFKQEPLQHTRMELYCHCRLPDNGQLMVQCVRCKRWFHETCETGTFSKANWCCMLCEQKKQHAENRKRPSKKIKSKLIAAAQTNLSKTAKIQKLYKAIKKIVQTLFLLPEGKTSIGCVSESQLSAIVSDKKNSQTLGITIFLKPISSFFICILPEVFRDEQQLFETVIHEIAHAVHFLSGGRGSMHGEEYRQCGRRVVCKIKNNMQRLPLPFRHCATPSRKCFNAKG